MPVRRPSAQIEIDGKRLSAAEAGLVSLRIDLSHNTHDAAAFTFWNDSKFAGAQPGSKASVAIGEADSEGDVWSGEISTARATPAGVVLEGLSPTVELSRTRRSETYQNQTAGAIAKDLAGSVQIDKVQADLQLPSYSIDSRRTVWAWLVDLARLTGSTVATAADGSLRFVPASGGGASHTFRYGAELLAWNLGQLAKPDALKVAPHGAGSSAGASKWHWLVHDPVGAGADPTRVVGSFHTKDEADALAKALGEQADRSAVYGDISVVGEPAVRPGDTVTLKDLPSGDPGPLRVRQVRHILHTARGYVTEITVESAGAAGGGVL